MLLLFKASPGGISISPFGFLIKSKIGGISYGKQVAVFLAGAAANLITAAVILTFANEGSLFCGALAVFNIMFAFINLLPVNNLDGGEALRALIICFSSLYTADNVIKYTSILFSVSLWLFAAYFCIIYGLSTYILILAIYLFTRIINR
jgi:Zn-dependent protease